MGCGHNAGEMLLETQIRFTRESLRIRTHCPKKTVYFLLCTLFPCGIRHT